ncbi:MAG: formate--tetrahydrofolate ligase [SAR202 cluster bacterium]|nr:formate--tetrahydrofolate ligase [SAR202 cluster bacterium]
MGLNEQDLIPYGKYKAKVDLSAIKNDKKGKMILVTGMTPTKAGEGKTTTSVGLTQSLGKLGFNVAATLREPSLGPIFGIKGGGTGGGKSTLFPEDEINVHFTGDAHAVSSAHNLLSALTDNVVYRGLIQGFSSENITWRRVVDMEDRALRSIVTGLGDLQNAPVRETGFDIVTASEIMAILSLSSDLNDLRNRLSRVIVGFTTDGIPVTAKDVNAVGSLMALLRYAIQPNLVQTIEGQPVLVHTGPFGNIAHGCSSVVGDKMALSYSDYVVTEAGFGADLGFEKFMHIKARFNNLEPSVVVLVTTVRAVKSHGGIKTKDLDAENLNALENGCSNVEHLINVINSFGLKVIVSINKFPTDTSKEVEILKKKSLEAGAYDAIECDVFSKGGDGALDLAQAVVEVANQRNAQINYLYNSDDSIRDKVDSLATNVYGAKDVKWSLAARRNLRKFTDLGFDQLPVCMAKTSFSISHDPKLLGKPEGYTFEISDLRVSAGAGFTYAIAGKIVTMPGLPSKPRSLDIDLNGNIINLS